MNHAVVSNQPSQLLSEILAELKLVRQELSLILPQEDLKDYAHPKRIASTYRKAMKEYPPLGYGNH